jgi:phospholipid/cholesterol/gamma-HCH transport system permease protein
LSADSYVVRLVDADPDEPMLHIEGRLALSQGAALWAELRRYTDPIVSGQTLHFEMSQVDSVDGGAMALLVQLRADLHRRGARSEFVVASPRVQELIRLYRGDIKVGPRKRRRAKGTLEQLGEATFRVFAEIKQVLAFLGSLLIAAGGVVRNPRSVNWGDLLPTMERTGADAVAIVVLINFLVGFVMAFQAAVQLKQFGANILVADLVGLSITRELGPLMTAIILSGRSGAAFAAELGSMKVSEEIDALRTMGFGPMRFLVLPRVIALMIVLPLLTLLADVMGMAGGLVVGLSTLDLSFVGYFKETQRALVLWDVFSGVLKSVVFALVIALISCQQGLATTGGAEGVGKRTTSAVVTTLFALILVDAGFTLVFFKFGL